MTDGADRTTSLRYVNGAPYLYLPEGHWRVEVRVDRRHRFRERETVYVGADGLLYPIGSDPVDDTRAVKVGA